MALQALRMPEPTLVPRPWLDSYPPGVPQRYDYPPVSLTRLLDDAAQDFPGTPAVIFERTALSYAKLLDLSDRFAAALQALGLRRGDRVALILPNCPQHVVALFGVLRIGATVVEVDPGEDAIEFGRQLEAAGARAIVFLDPVYEKLERLRARLTTVEHYIATGLQEYLPWRRRVLFPLRGRRDGWYAKIPRGEGVLRLGDLIKRSAPAFVQTQVDPESDVAVILYSAKRGGERKPVCLTHYNVVANAFQARLWIPDMQAGRERILGGVALSSSWGFTTCVGVGVLSAATFILVTDLGPDAMIHYARRQKATMMLAPPATFAMLADDEDAPLPELPHLRISIATGAPLPPRVVGRFEEQTGSKLREAFGIAETGPFTHANPVYGPVKSGSIGLPISDTICAVVDRREVTRPVRPGMPGELAIYGPQVMKGYWNRASDTAAVLKDGWLLTGAIVEVDPDGYFHLVDEKTEVIEVRGRSVVPKDVEAVLIRHPKVAHAAVAGIPEFDGGEMLKAYVVLEPGQTATSGEIDEFCRAELAPHQVPARYEFRSFLPQALPGRAMREALIAEELGGPGLRGTGL